MNYLRRSDKSGDIIFWGECSLRVDVFNHLYSISQCDEYLSDYKTGGENDLVRHFMCD